MMGMKRNCVFLGPPAAPRAGLPHEPGRGGLLAGSA